MTKSRGIRKGRGRDLLAKNPDGTPIRPRSPPRDNRPKKISIVHGGRSDVIFKDFDLRSVVGRRYQEDLFAFRSHLGGDLSIAQEKLVNMAARLSILNDLAWGEVSRSKRIIQKDGPVPAVATYLRTAKELRDVLGVIGLERRARDVTLLDILEGRRSGENPIKT